MKFLCDVHIPLKLVKQFEELGFSAMHVNQLPDKWYTPDTEICRFADAENFIVVTKDADFRNSFFVRKSPQRLIKINLGNISNKKLLDIFSENIEVFKNLRHFSSFMIEIDEKDIKLTRLD